MENPETAPDHHVQPTAFASAASADATVAQESTPQRERRRRSRHSRRSKKSKATDVFETREEENDPSGNDTAGPNATASWISVAMAITTVTTLFLAGGTSHLGKAVATGLIGLLMVIAPVQRQLPTFVKFCMLVFVLVPLCGFFPANWLGPPPSWRTQLSTNWGIDLAGTVSPQPGTTFEAWILLAAGMGWFWFCLGREFQTPDRRSILRIITLGGVFIAGLTLAQSMNLLNIPIWPEKSPFPPPLTGPFPNRNIISSLAALTAVLCAACAYDAYRQRSRLWLVFGISILVPTGVIVTNTSRAGMVLLALGLGMWLVTSGMRRGFFKKIALAGSVGLVLGSLLLFYAPTLTHRLKTDATPSGIVSDSRFLIYGETIDLIAKDPWTGISLGNFAEVFGVTNNIDNTTSQMLHPESDWLWMLTEGGLLLAIPAGLIVIWLVGGTGPWTGGSEDTRRRRQDRRLRNAAGLCFFLGIAHGIVDIPNHNFGYAVLSLLFAGIAVHQRNFRTPAGAISRFGARLAGLAILATSVNWASLALGRPILASDSSAAILRQKAAAQANSSHDQEALASVNEAIQYAPLQGMSYFLRAQILLRLGRPSNAALADFARARALYPRYVPICMDEAQIWLKFDPPRAIIPWREALRRNPNGAAGTYGLYAQMLGYAAPYRALQDQLWNLATTPSLKVTFLLQTSGTSDWEKALSALLLQQPKLDGLEPIERSRLFQAWWQRGDRDQFLAALEQNSAWQKDAWQLLAAEYASRSRFKEAWAVIAKFAVRPQLPAVSPTVDVEALERTALFNPTDPVRQIDLFFAQRATQRYVEARRTLEKTLGMPNAPEYLKLELADLYALQDDYRRAWEIAREYLKLP